MDSTATEAETPQHGYRSGYAKSKSISEQVKILRRIFPDIGFADERLAEKQLPNHAEGWFAIPRWQLIAPSYGEAVRKVFDKLKEERKGRFHDFFLAPDTSCEGNLLETDKKRDIFQKLGEEQDTQGILVVAAQFGLRYRGIPSLGVRTGTDLHEFCLGAFEVGVMLLTHPDRLMCFDDLHIHCAGDNYDLDLDGDPEDVLSLGFDVEGLEVEHCWIGLKDGSAGAATGFLPQ